MPTYPIILAHGIARFDIVRERLVQRLHLDDASLPDRFHYFRNIHSHLSRHGFKVHHTSVRWAGSVEERAADLKEQLGKFFAESPGHSKVHIIGHSMGGLDARCMIAELGMAPRVCSLTTIGTPHWGSSFADWGLKHGGEAVLEKLKEVVHLDGFLNLTSLNGEAFNERLKGAEIANDVFYQTYACWEEKRDRVFTPLQLSWQVIKDAEKAEENDGLVSVKSQRWTERLQKDGREKEVLQHDFPVLGDHFNEVGWWEVHQLSGKLRLSALRNPIAFIKSLFNDRSVYENQIKDTYLSIAKDLERRFPA